MDIKTKIMKSKLTTLFLFCSTILAAQNIKTIKCTPDNATVYLNGVQLYYSENVNIPVGTSEYAFQGVSPMIDPSSIITGGKGNFTILDAQFNTRYPETIELKPDNPLLLKYQKQIKSKQDSIKEIGYDLSLYGATKQALIKEKDYLQNNKIIKGETKRDSVMLVKDALQYFRERQANIDLEWNKILRAEDKLIEKKQYLETSINDIQQLINKVMEGTPQEGAQPIYEVIITIQSDEAIAGSIQFNYYTSSASWLPEYELKASSTSSNISLIQKAKLVQNTGIDWKDVKLTLSTGNPSLSNTKPYLNPYYLQLIQAQKKETLSSKFDSSTDDEKDLNEISITSSGSATLFAPDANQAYNWSTVAINPVQVEYSISLSYNIPSDNKAHTIAIQKKDIGAKMEYYCVPKLDRDAFLQARIIDWEDMNLIPGQAKIYFDNSFVGNSSINPSETDDTLNIDLGRDKTIVVERKILKEKSKTTFIEGDKIVTRFYTINIRNTKATSVKILLQDQIPLSTQKDVIVTADETSGATLDENTGILSWNLNIKSKEQKLIKFSYTVKFPGAVNLSSL